MEQDALLQGILESPDEDAPRLVYADWLEEHGTTEADRARAELIRTQARLATLRYDDDRVSPLQARALRLLSRHRYAWFAGCLYGRTHRGFVDQLDFWTPEAFAEHGPALFARQPVRDVEVGSQSEPGWGRT